MSHFYVRLQYVAGLKKIDQIDLSNGLSIDSSTVNRWWNGKVVPRTKSIRAIADFLGCNLNWLTTGNGDPYPEVGTYKRTKEESAPATSESEALKQVRMYRELAQMDADTLGEIQTWLNDMEKIRPGFTGWFRLEFQNRFPEFDEWKSKITKNNRTGTDS